MKNLKSIFKFLALGGMVVAAGLLVPTMNVDATELGTDDVPVTVIAGEEAIFLSISLFNASELVFDDINHYTSHNTWINPRGGNRVDLVIDSSRPWTLAVEGDNFVGIDESNLGEILPLYRLRTRVERAVLPNGQIIYTNSLTNANNSSGAGVTNNQIGADNAFRQLLATGRQQKVVTNRVGRNFTYRMQFQFQGNQTITPGEYTGAIRYAAWQR